MLIEVKVPVLPESITEATLVNWHKKAGDAVSRDENLVDIETDKVVLELPAPDSGVLTEVRRTAGTTVVAQEVIALLDTQARAGATTSAAVAPPVRAVDPAATATAAPPAGASPLPAARKMMQNLAAADVAGTGRGGRITKGDVTTAVEAKAAQPVRPAPAAAPASKPPAVVPAADLGARPEQRVPMSRLRQRVAERLLQSQSSAAILTTFNEVNMAPVIELRNRYKDRFEKENGVKLGFMGFFVRAVVHALKKFPAVNASVDGTDIIYHGYFDIGIAVGSPRGLVVPILRDADQMTIAEIEQRIADFGKRAQEGKLTVQELTGGTYTISNGGVFGSMLSTPIINPPQSAILGVHATRDRPVVENGQIVVRPINYLAQSYDHRIIDGREAVLSLVAIKEALEDPARMLLDV